MRLCTLAKKIFPNLNTESVRNGWGHVFLHLITFHILVIFVGTKNVCAAVDHGHIGIAMVPKNIEVVIASLIAVEAPGLDMKPYRLNRF